MTQTYASILAELKRRRDSLATELKGVSVAIAAIEPLVGSETPVATEAVGALEVGATLAPPIAAPVNILLLPHDSPAGNYSRISVRWAALWHLAEYARRPLRNVEVADAIRAGGYHSGAGSFPNAVSAVLSVMRAKGEIDGNPEGGYFLTDKGKHIWDMIRNSERFRSIMAHSSSPNEPSLLSVQ